MKSVTKPDGTVVSFKYDPFGRCIQKSSPAKTVNYLYDGANIVEERDAAGLITRRYVHGHGVDEPLAYEQSGVKYFYHADALGSITAITNASGTVTASTVFDAFGYFAHTMGQAYSFLIDDGGTIWTVGADGRAYPQKQQSTGVIVYPYPVNPGPLMNPTLRFPIIRLPIFVPVP